METQYVRIREELWKCLLKCWFDEVFCLNPLKEMLFVSLLLCQKGNDKVKWNDLKGDFALHWELLSLLQSEMLSEHRVTWVHEGEGAAGREAGTPGDCKPWEIQGTETGLAMEVTLFSWKSGEDCLEFVAILAISLSRKLKAVVGRGLLTETQWAGRSVLIFIPSNLVILSFLYLKAN